MWNPDEYRDTDFGLVDGETFEPIEDGDDDDYRPGPNDPFLQSVLGPVPLDEVGLALVREHLQLLPPPACESDTDGRLDDPKAALLDLEAFFTVNGRTVVSATPGACGRDAAKLKWLAQHAPVHIVGATGFPAREYLAQVYDAGAVGRMRDDLERDLTEGLDGSDVLPGILVVGIGGAEPSPLELHAVDLVGDAHRRFGLPVLLSVADQVDRLPMVRRLADAGITPERMIVVAGSGIVNFGAATDLADTGTIVLFDGLGSVQDVEIARTIARLIADGYGDHIVVSHGYTRRSRLTGYGGRPGLSYVVEQFAVMLLEEGLEALNVRRILMDNASRALATRRGPGFTSTT